MILTPPIFLTSSSANHKVPRESKIADLNPRRRECQGVFMPITHHGCQEYDLSEITRSTVFLADASFDDASAGDAQ